ncbi:DUF3298 and DUF4163 domain-containing protein [Bacillus taeanensis]|uniref:DUF3298 domain-containing protein n=1 Tax=Bacillus taeanensis TaxID=273032 RepID=A0A366XZX4_9BACI|nr:DUF3298 and DUF4163 domain-containing protein [Bacillus taeanensis]RBW69703.1 hypothetical protein DS031_10275 [Bacillus taeanensis]
MDQSKFPVYIQTVSHITPNLQLYYPKIIGMQNQHVQEKMNHTIMNQVHQLINMQRKVQIQGKTEMTGFYEIKSNERGVLSLLQSNYAYTPPMAHGMTYAKSLTFSVLTGKNYHLSKLFKPNSSYVKVISDLIRAQIKERNIPLLGEFKGIKPNQDFYIADKALVIYFQLYEITPYYVGFPMFPISVYKLQDLIMEDSPLGKMLADI